VKLPAARVLVALATAGFALVLAVPAAAAPQPGCRAGLRCLVVRVPLDRAGKVPGTVPLHVEVRPAGGKARGVMFLLAGGPGQAGLDAFRLGTKTIGGFYASVLPGYTLVAYDIRGTGRSGKLDCSGVSTWAACARKLGPRRDFYGTADHAEDLEAIREALGSPRIGLWGTSYGTRLALAYSVAHPEHVSRLLLDSAAPLREPDPFGGRLYAQLPGALRRLCAQNVCRAATPDFAGDFAAVANRLAAKPVTGSVRGLASRGHPVRLTQWKLLGLVFDVELWRVGSELPAATRAARAGDWRPLLRLVDLVSGHPSETGESVNTALLVATVCRDGPVPWTTELPVFARPAAVAAALLRLPKGSSGPFGRWTTQGGVAHTCLDWPSPAGGARLGTKPLPDVPVLVLSGDLDTVTGVADAVAIKSQFRHGRLVVVPGVGHGVLETDPSECSRSAVKAWLAARALPARCPRPERLVVPPIPAFTPPDPAATKRPATPTETLHIAARTLREAVASWQLIRATRQKLANGLTSGYLALIAPHRIFLLDYGIEAGVKLRGRVGYVREGNRFWFTASIDVSGSRAATGTLVLDHDTLAGTLGGVPVSAHTEGHVGG
jgi:pimeloyl-ACP methyl ester carboxylesterase